MTFYFSPYKSVNKKKKCFYQLLRKLVIYQSRNKYNSTRPARDAAKINFTANQLAVKFPKFGSVSTMRRFLWALSELPNVREHSRVISCGVNGRGIAYKSEMTFYYFCDLARAIVRRGKHRVYKFTKEILKRLKTNGVLKYFSLKNKEFMYRTRSLFRDFGDSDPPFFNFIGKDHIGIPYQGKLIETLCGRDIDLRATSKMDVVIQEEDVPFSCLKDMPTAVPFTDEEKALLQAAIDKL